MTKTIIFYIKRFISAPLWQKFIYSRNIFSRIMNKIYYSKIFNNIGKTSIIQSPIFISHPECIYIGNNVFIREGLRIEAITQFGDQKFKPFLSIGDNINIEQNVHITCANSLTIGNQTTISSGVLIADNDHCYEQIDKNIMQQQLKIAPTKIGEYCFIGSGAKILAGTILGKQCIVGANAVVRMKNFPDYSVIVGSPARVVKQLNKESMRWEKIETD